MRKVGIGVGLGALVAVGIAALLGRSTPKPAPAERAAPSRPAVRAEPVEASAPASTSTVVPDEGPIASPWRRTALTPVHAAPPLGLADLGAEAGGESSVAVDPFTGLATLWERDVSLAGWPALRRARTLGDDSTGLFGRGWRSELEATLHRDGDGFVLVGLEGLTRLRPTERGVWLTELGEVQALIATDDGYEVDDPAGRLHRFDRTGRLVEIVGEVRIARVATGLRLAGPSGELVLELDAAGRAVRARGGDRIDVRYAYEGDELVRVEGSARRAYRAAPGRFEAAGGAGPLLAASLDDRGAVASLESPGRGPGFVQTYTFDRGLAEVRGPAGRWRYEAQGDGWRIATPTGPERAELDGRGRVTCLSVAGGPVQPVARHDGLERALRGERAAVTSSAPRALRGRDDAGRVVVEVGPAGRTEFERDGAGRVRARTDGAGRVIRAVRDRAGQVESITGDAGGELSFEHDLAGRPTRATAGEHALAFGWDGLGRQTSEDGPEASLRWTHGPREVRLTTPWGELARGTDEAGRVTTLATPAGAFRWEHDAQGQARRLRAPNGVVTELGRDAHGREATRSARDRSGRALLEVATTRDASGLATRIRRDGAAFELTRDARGRLTRAGDLSYAWGASGDRLGAETLAHDAAGRLLRREGPSGETRYGWDDLGRLSRVERRAATGALETVRYAYDALGRLASRTTSAGATRYVHADGQLLAELGPGERTRVWVHGPGLDAPLAYGDRATDGAPFAWTFLHGDAAETTLAYSDAAGARVAQAVLGPFGETIAAPGDRPVLFAGRLVDPLTGLVHLRARWYAPELGRFLDADPIGPDGGESPWLYCDGDPVERRDPLGLAPTPTAPAPVPTVWDRLRAATNTGLDLAARLIDAGRVAAADAVAHEQSVVRDYQVTLTRAGLLDPPGRERPTYTGSAIVNFCHDATSATLNGLLDARQAGLALLQDAIAPDARGTGATGAFAQGWTETSIGVRKAIERAQDHYGHVAELLVDDGHGLVTTGFLTGAIIVGDHILPVTKAREAVVGKDLHHFTRTGDERLLSAPERVQRGLEVASEAAGSIAGSLANRAAKTARAAEEAAEVARAVRAAQAADDAADARRAGAAARTPEPNKGLAQALDPDAERGAARAAEAADAERPRGDGADGPTAARPPRRELPVVQDDGCFLAGTLVETATGRRPIETIAVGDRVLARSERTGATRWRRVSRLFPNLTAAVTSLWLASAGPGGSLELQTVRCTPNHPVWRAGDGFVRADALRPGDGLSSASAAPVLVLGARTVAWSAPTFNFEVEEDHTYFVSGRESAAAIWVHNTCEEALRARFDAEAAAGKTTKSWDEYRADYVKERTDVLGLDPARNKVQPHEGRIGTELELRGMVDGQLERLPVKKGKGIQTPEWRETAGKRRTFDEIAGSIPDRFVEEQLENLERSLVDHFKKADVTVVQVTNMSPANKARVRALVERLRASSVLPPGKDVWVVDF